GDREAIGLLPEIRISPEVTQRLLEAVRLLVAQAEAARYDAPMGPSPISFLVRALTDNAGSLEEWAVLGDLLEHPRTLGSAKIEALTALWSRREEVPSTLLERIAEHAEALTIFESFDGELFDRREVTSLSLRPLALGLAHVANCTHP